MRSAPCAAYEITRDMPMQEIEMKPRWSPRKSRVIDGKKVVLASIPAGGQRVFWTACSTSFRARVFYIGPLPRPRHPASGGVFTKMPPAMSAMSSQFDFMLATGKGGWLRWNRLKLTTSPIRFTAW